MRRQRHRRRHAGRPWRRRDDIRAIRQILEKSESAIERANLEDRLEEWEGELTAAEQRAATLAEAAVLFDGAPVKANIGIDAAFGGQSVRAFQELVTTVAADLSPRGVGERGKLSADVPRLLITDVDVGSFGFQLAEVPDQEPPAGTSPLKNALDASTRLVRAAGRMAALKGHIDQSHAGLATVLELPLPDPATKEQIIRKNTNRLNRVSYWYCLDAAGKDERLAVHDVLTAGNKGFTDSFWAVDQALRSSDVRRPGGPRTGA